MLGSGSVILWSVGNDDGVILVKVNIERTQKVITLKVYKHIVMYMNYIHV